MNVDRRLTLILPVRGRPEYTRRWLDWARESALPFPVIVADGSEAADAGVVARKVAVGVAEGRAWAHRASRTGILARVADAAARVETPFAALAANDDFPLRAGLAACTAALEARPDAAACGGPAAAVALPCGEPIWSANARARTPVVRSPLDGASSLARIEYLLDAYDPPWYDVQRVEVMRAAFQRIERSGLRDLHLCELLHAVGVASGGPCLRTPLPHLVRQEDAADSASAEIADRGDLLAEILAEGWGAQFEIFIGAASDAAGGDSTRPNLRAAYIRYARAVLARTPGFGGRLPLRRRVAAAAKAVLGDRAVEVLKRARVQGTPAAKPARELAPILAFLAGGPGKATR